MMDRNFSPVPQKRKIGRLNFVLITEVNMDKENTYQITGSELIEKMATAIPPALDGGLRLHKA